MKKEEQSSSPVESEYKNRFDFKTLITVLVLILVTTVFVLWSPRFQTTFPERLHHRQLVQQPSDQNQPGSEQEKKLVGSEMTEDPATLQEYATQTNGIVLCAVVIVLVIIGGTFSVIQRKG